MYKKESIFGLIFVCILKLLNKLTLSMINAIYLSSSMAFLSEHTKSIFSIIQVKQHIIN